MRQNRRAKLIILCGLPGSGKTTLAKALEFGPPLCEALPG